MSNQRKNVLITPAFLSDLRATYQMLAEPPTFETEREFMALETSLEEAQKESMKRSISAHSAYKSSHPQSPLFESVSLFEPMGFERLESALTRTLAWLLDPRKPHGLDASFLGALLKLLSTKSDGAISIEQVSGPVINSEWQVNKACRVDIAISDQTRDWVLLIEAKIDAHERVDQLQDYYEAAKAAGFPQVHGIYLTTEQSKKTTDADGHWQHMLYDELAGELLKLLDADTDTDSKNRIHPLVGYFVAGLLRDICGWHTNRDAEELLKSVNCFEFESFAKRYFR